MAKGLGRGLNAFFPEEKTAKTESVQDIEVNQLRPNPYQPRQVFDKEALQELSQSISEQGIVQPLIVRKSIKGYDVVAGERRLRASKIAGLQTVPAIVKQLTDEQMMEIALIENLQRENLNALEEAKAYEKLMDHLSFTQDELAKRVGKSRPHITNYLRLLQLPKNVQQMVEKKELTMGHARALLSIKDKKTIDQLAGDIVKNQWNVRKTEEIIKAMHEKKEDVSRETSKPSPSIFIRSTENSLKSYFGTKVAIKQGKKKGKIEIDFFSEEDLKRIIELLDKDE